MLLLALSEAAKTTLAEIAIWFVGFPLLVTVLIAYAIFAAHGEKQAYERTRRHTPLEPPHHLT